MLCEEDVMQSYVVLEVKLKKIVRGGKDDC